MLSTEALTSPDQWLAFSQLNFISGPVSLLCHHHYAGSGMMVEIYMGKPKQSMKMAVTMTCGENFTSLSMVAA
jgi:hypothetical protein